jgi:hypothetical protein
VETVRVKADCSHLTGALELVLAERGYSTLRSFDLPLNAAKPGLDICSSCAERCSDGCICRYTVLLVLPRPGISNAEVISIQGKGANATVTLLPYHPEDEFIAQFGLLLMEAMHVSQNSVPGDPNR